MLTKQHILVAGRSKQAVASVRDLLGDAPQISVEAHLIDERQPDPLHRAAQRPDLVVLLVTDHAGRELEALTHGASGDRPPLIVVGEAGNPECMRAAMRAGARDFLTQPVSRDELLACVARIALENQHVKQKRGAHVTAFINAKGGSGATFIASNMAYLFAGPSSMATALLDLDLQFGTLSEYLDIETKRGLLEALDVAADLDDTAIEAYLAKHESGLAVLAGSRDGTMLRQDLLVDRFDKIFDLLIGNFDRVVVDVPRHLESFGVRALERADRVVLVLQQSVPSLHEAVRLFDLMTRNLAIPRQNVSLVVNRFHKAASVEIADIEKSFSGVSLLCIPNDYRAVVESINMGMPIYEHARRSPVTKALLRLEADLAGKSVDVPKGFLTMLGRAAM